MITTKLQNLITLGEGQTLEFKRSTAEIDKAIQELVSFANTSGGIILIGVSDEGRIIGVSPGVITKDQIANKITGNTDPVLHPKIDMVEIEGKKIMVITVDESKNKPHLAFGRAYKRVGSISPKMPRDEYDRLLLEKHKDELQFDNQICKEATLDDINEKKVRWFLTKAKRERNLDIDPKTSIKEALERLKLIRDDKLTSASILLFGKNPRRFFLQAETRCARFKGIAPVKPFTDMKVFDGNIIDQVDKALSFVLDHIPMAVWLVPGQAAREEKYEYPPDAIREAIANAICHRDYRQLSNVQVRIFDDRIEVWGCGSLPEPLTPEGLKKKHRSILRNPLIGNCFFLIKLIEQWGTGTNDIIDMCLGWGLPEPEFEDITGALVVTFRKSKLTDEHLDGLGLNKRQREAINYLRVEKQITSKKYSEKFKVTDRTARNDLKKLINNNLLKRVGETDKKTYYVLAEI
ncbi:helix-turn-helix domain-containing protein [bacterium]|nr:helix-turn-helix domain-containing protein [bacterium]MBU1487245.1 helix-turn-helix domain-containing protein [bacterium]